MEKRIQLALNEEELMANVGRKGERKEGKKKWRRKEGAKKTRNRVTKQMKGE